VILLLDRIRDLIALSSSPSENEARNAAYEACKLLREHKVELALPSQPLAEDFDVLVRARLPYSVVCAQCFKVILAGRGVVIAKTRGPRSKIVHLHTAAGRCPA
jgi:hypothetical protein